MQLTTIIAIGIFLPMLVLVFISGLKFKELSERAAKSEAISAAQQYANEIQDNLNQVFASINNYANTYESLLKLDGSKGFTVAEIHEIQKEFLVTNEMGISVYVILMPGNIIDTSETQLNEKLTLLANDRVNVVLATYESWDYHFKSNVEDTLKKGGGYMLLPPYIESSIGNKSMLVITYGHAIEANGKFKGLVGIDISIDWIQEFISKINLFNNKAHISIISSTGIINADNKNDTLVGKNIKDVLKSYPQESAKLMASSISDIKNNGDYIFYVPIKFNKLESSWHIRISVPESEILKTANKELLVRIIIIGLITLFAIILSYFYLNKLSNRISKLAGYAKLVAKGKLNIEFESSGKDEITELSSSLQAIVTRFSNIIKGLKNSLTELKISTDDLSKTSVRLHEGATVQASSTEEVSASMEEMSANIDQNTENAKIADAIAKKSSKEIEISSKNVKNTATSMGEIAKKITIINDIAFQVNILALNAAVEAARAGIHGKGFGVVAAEVGKLADRSKLAAYEIEQLTNNSVTIAKQSGTTLSKIVPEIQRTAILVQDITNASIEQKAGTDQINSAIQQLNDVTQQNASSAEQLASHVESLSILTDKLNKLISFFKIEEESKEEVKHKREGIISKNKLIIKDLKKNNLTYEKDEVEPELNLNKSIPKEKKVEDKGFNLNLGNEQFLDDGFEKF